MLNRILNKLIERVVSMGEKEDLKDLKEKINNERKKLDKLVLEGLGKEGLLELSCKLDLLINDYYQIAFNYDTNLMEPYNK